MRLKEDITVGIDVKEAVHRAKTFAAELLEAEKISNLGLEAVERSTDRRYWLVTLGFTRRFPEQKQSGIVVVRKPDREYKVFQVDGQSGDVVAMKVFAE